MQIRKSFAAIGAALVMIGVSAPVWAQGYVWDDNVCGDKAATSAELVRLSEHIRCGDDYPHWPAGNPIWEKMGSGSCDVHESLADKLWVEPSDPADANPRGKGKGAGKVTEGAAQKVLEEKYEDAIQKLVQLAAAIDKSKPNHDFDPYGADGATLVSDHLQIIVEQDAISCVRQLLY